MSTEQAERKEAAFLKHMLVYGVGTLSLQVVSIALLPLYTRQLDPSQYGLVQLLYRVSEVLNLCLMVNGLQLAALNLYGQTAEESKRRSIGPTLSGLLAVVLVAGTVLVVALSRPLSSYLDIESPRLFSCGVIAIMLQATTTVPLALMQARMNSKSYVVSTVAIALCHVASALVTVGLLDWGVWGVVAALAITYGASGAVLTLRELSRSVLRIDMQLMRTAIRFAAPFIPGGLLFFVLASGDQFFLMKFSGFGVLGLYALGYRIANVAMLMIDPFRQVWNAWMYEAYRRPDRSELFGRVITRGLGLYMFGGVILVAFMDEVFAMLTQPEYAKATRVVAPIVVGNFFLAASYLLDAAFYVKRRTQLKPLIAAASTVVMLTLYAVLIPRYHDLGAAYATVLGYLFHAGLTMLVAQRVFKIVLEGRRVAGALLLSVVISAGTQALGTGILDGILKLALCAAWVLLAWVFLAQEEEKQATLAGARRIWRLVGTGD